MKIQVLVGMIASGKSTYAKNAAKSGYITINDDSIVNLVHGDDYTLYDKKLKVLYKSIEQHIISMSVAIGRNVVVDRGLNLNLSGRQRWISLARSLDLPCEAVCFKIESPQIHAERRANSDVRGHDYAYWLNVAEFHHKKYQPPTFEEGFNAVHFVSFDEIKEGKVF